MIELKAKKLLKPEEESGRGKVFSIRDVADERTTRYLETLFEQQLVMLNALEYLVSNVKNDNTRDVILKNIHTEKEKFRDVQQIPARSEDIAHVVEMWERHCGANNRWVKALKSFQYYGGNIRWVDGTPTPGAMVYFELYNDKWEKLKVGSYRLADINNGIKILRGIE